MGPTPKTTKRKDKKNPMGLHINRKILEKKCSCIPGNDHRLSIYWKNLCVAILLSESTKMNYHKFY